MGIRDRNGPFGGIWSYTGLTVIRFYHAEYESLKKKKIPLPPKFLAKVCMRTILVFFCLVCILVVSTFYNKGAFTGNR